MAPPPREVELKLALSPADVPYLQRHPRVRRLAVGRAVTRTLHSVYFDTPDLDLHRRRIGLRVRDGDGKRVQTLETGELCVGGLFERGELESPLDGQAPDLAAIPDARLRERLLRELADKPLEPVFETRMRRTHRLLRDGDDEWTLDVDVGETRAGAVRAPFCEVELELRRGAPARLYALALELQHSLDLHPRCESRAELGYALVTGRRAPARRAGRVPVRRGDTLEAVLSAVVASGIEQIAANAALVGRGDDPEGVHQLRVGARRLRSALGAFEGVAPSDALEHFRSELRWLGGELGRARDLDVFVAELLDPVLRARPQDAGLALLRAQALRLRAEQQGRVRACVESRRFARLVLELGHWRARAGWREQPLAEGPAALLGPAAPFSAALLARRARHARRAGRGLRSASPEQRHALRIRLKKLRYAAEAFCGLYPARASEHWLRQLSRLQDDLGHLNDVATAERVLERLLEGEGEGEGAGPDSLRAAGVVTGWWAHAAERAGRRLLRHWKRFRRTPGFWEHA